MDLHVDGGLVNTSNNASHVIVAVQAILHASPMLKFLAGDKIHQSQCRSPSQCLLCTFNVIRQSMIETGVGDPSSLVIKWHGTSSRMPEDKKIDPLNVLNVFVDLLRMQLLQLNPERDINTIIECYYVKYSNFFKFLLCYSCRFTLTDVLSHPMSSMWYSCLTSEVSCSSCGVLKKKDYMPVVDLTEVVSDVQSSITDRLWGSKKDICPQCKRTDARITTYQVELAECLKVHLERRAVPFILPFSLDLKGVKLDLRSIILQPVGVKKEPCKYVSVCPDGRFRKFDDCKISLVGPATLYSDKFIQDSKLTLIFERRVEKQLHPVITIGKTNESRKDDKSSGFQDVSSLDVSSLNLSSSSKTRNLDSEASFIDSDTSGLHTEISSIATEASFLDSSMTTMDTSLKTNAPVADVGIQTGRFPYTSFQICKNHKKFKFFTGLNVEDFDALFNLIGGHEVISTLKINYGLATPKKKRQSILSSKDKLFLFLLRLRRGLPLEELSEIFCLSVAMVGELCYVMTRLIYLTFKKMEDEMFVSAAAQRKDKPKKMWPFKNLRVLLDGASFFIQTPSNFEQQGNTFSSYKSHNVLVFSIGISCNGATIFCSDAMEGSMSDKEVILKSGLLDKLSKGDGVMTDRGYELTAELQAIGCDFFKPPSLGDRQHFTPEEEILTKAIASARIYTEHAVADIKDNRLLQGTIPLTLLPVIGNLVYIAAYLRNFNSSRIHDRKFVVKEIGERNVRDEEDPDNPDPVEFKHTGIM